MRDGEIEGVGGIFWIDEKKKNPLTSILSFMSLLYSVTVLFPYTYFHD